MEKFKLEDLKELMSESEDALISIYLPTFKKGTEINKSRIQLKNLLKVAEEKLANKGMGERDAKNYLEPARKLLDETIFWQNQEESLALFVSEKEFKYFKLPIDVEPTVVISNVYYIRPLLKLITSYTDFNVLTLSQDDIKLYKCNQYSIEKMSVPTIDEIVDDYIPIAELNREAHSPKGAAASGAGPGMHGYNEMSKTEKNDISNHLKSIDREVNKLLKDEKNPLIIYSVDYIFPMYKEVSSYGNILEGSIKGSPLEANQNEIHSKAMEIFRSSIDGKYRKEVERFYNIKNTTPDLASIDLEKIVKNAYKGSIETIFVAYDVQEWGKFDEQNFTIEILNTESDGSRDLLDYAALTTLQNGGKVYITDRVEIPESRPLAAVLRY